MNELDKARFETCLRFGDSALILGHRLSEWCGHGPVLEEDIAMTNIALDFVGLSQNLLTYAATIEAAGRTEDDLAFLRDARDYRNALLTEQPNGDFAVTMLRQFFYDVFSNYLYHELAESKDEGLKAIAGKACKETEYHLRHSHEWMLMLGNGTTESHNKLQAAINELWMYTGDLFTIDDNYKLMMEHGLVPDLNMIKDKWMQTVTDVMKVAIIIIPQQSYMQQGSMEGKHTEHLGYLLAEMQFMQRAYPNSTW